MQELRGSHSAQSSQKPLVSWEIPSSTQLAQPDPALDKGGTQQSCCELRGAQGDFLHTSIPSSLQALAHTPTNRGTGTHSQQPHPPVPGTGKSRAGTLKNLGFGAAQTLLAVISALHQLFLLKRGAERSSCFPVLTFPDTKP